MGRGSGDHGTSVDRRPQRRQAGGIGGGLGHVELEISGVEDVRRAELAIALGMRSRLRETKIEAAEQCGDRGGNAPPALEGALGDATVDQDQGDAALGAGHDQIGPEVRLDEEREVGLPVVEEALDEARRIENHELMDQDRKSTRLNSSHLGISYAVFCLKKK